MPWGPHSEKTLASTLQRACYVAQRGYFRLREKAHARGRGSLTPCTWVDAQLAASPQHGHKRVFVTTVLRNSQDNHMTGLLYELDWETRKVLRAIPLALTEGAHFWNPRGANRGGRGMAVMDGTLLVGVAQRILKFDSLLNYLGAIENPNFGSLHGVAVQGDTIWATSGLHDMIVNIDRNGKCLELWRGHESQKLRRRFFLPRRVINTALDFPAERFLEDYVRYSAQELFHINALHIEDNAVYASLPRIRSVIRLDPSADGLIERIVFTDPRLSLGHDLILWENRFLINDTHRQSVRVYSRSGRLEKALDTMLVPLPRRSRIFYSGGWQRGLAHLHDSVFLVGTSPATVFELDVRNNRIGQVMQIDSDINNSVHNILVTSEL